MNNITLTDEQLLLLLDIAREAEVTNEEKKEETINVLEAEVSREPSSLEGFLEEACFEDTQTLEIVWELHHLRQRKRTHFAQAVDALPLVAETPTLQVKLAKLGLNKLNPILQKVGIEEFRKKLRNALMLLSGFYGTDH